MILRNQIESSAAPEEPVLIDDWLLHRALLWKGSTALKQQLVYLSDGKLPAQFLNSPQEMVLAVAEGDSLLRDLQTRGFTVAPNASQAAWVAGGRGFHTPGRPAFRIYFILPAPPQPAASPPSGATP